MSLSVLTVRWWGCIQIHCCGHVTNILSCLSLCMLMGVTCTGILHSNGVRGRGIHSCSRWCRGSRSCRNFVLISLCYVLVSCLQVNGIINRLFMIRSYLVTTWKPQPASFTCSACKNSYDTLLEALDKHVCI